MAQIALNWLLQRPTVSTVILGAVSDEYIHRVDALDAVAKETCGPCSAV